MDKNRVSGFCVVTAVGGFALAAQTLLFRDFFTVFEGNELGIAAFFASWLVWVAVGAYAGRAATRLTPHFPILALAYVPFFVFQEVLILHARQLAGIQSYQLFPFARMFAVSFAANAPVSVLTGFLFTVACRWAKQHVLMPVSHVYIYETLGSCLGGVAVTFFLWRGIAGEVVALYAIGVLVAATMGFYVNRKWLLALFFPILAVAITWLANPIGMKWAEHNCRAEWARLLPAETYQGHFTTAQGRYLYGTRDNQFTVMSNGGVCETLPAGEHAAEVAALHLAEKPDTRKVLVFGENALGLCSALERFPQITNVTWLHPDPEFPRKMLALIAEKRLAGLDGTRLNAPSVDIGAFVQTSGLDFDLVILNLPDIATLAQNRFCTEEFLASIKRVLAANGAVSARVLGVANYAGSEITYLGASILSALRKNFKHVVLKPGDESWLIASDGDGLSQEASALAGRFAAIKGAEAVYPSQGILALFPSDRVAFQLKAYEAVIAAAGGSLLRNTEASPKALLYALLITIKQAGWRALAMFVPALLKMGICIFLLPIILFLLLRLAYVLKTRPGVTPGIFDFQFLIFATGFAGMAFSILLLFVYQSYFGSLFLDIGLLSALFMLGSFLGGAALQYTLFRVRARARNSYGPADESYRPNYEPDNDDPDNEQVPTPNLKSILLLTLLAQILVLLAVPFIAEIASRAALMPVFILCGFFTGAYFPIAAMGMQAAGRNETSAGSSLEAFDTLGGAAGALLTGLLFLPILGRTQTIWVLALLVAVNVVPIFLRQRFAPTGDFYDRLHRPVGYALAGIALFALAVSQAAAMVLAADAGELVKEAARALAGSSDVHEEHARLSNGKSVTYYTLWNGLSDRSAHPDGYIFGSEGWGPKTRGYGGPMTLAIHVDKQGALKDYKIVRSRETPAYQAKVEAKKQRLMGKNLFTPDPFKGVDGVSGATITSDAITRMIETAGRGFAEQVLGKNNETAAGDKGLQPLVLRTLFTGTGARDCALLAGLALAAVLSRYWPNRWVRRLLLLLSLAAAGYWLNAQFSMQQVVSLLQLNFGAIGWNAPFFLLAIVPLLAVLFGNVYCGYLCPFGAIQDFLSDLLPARFKMNPAKKAWRYGRAVKYGILFALAILFALSRDIALAQADPLVTFFSGALDGILAVLVIASLFFSLFYNRFWCRNLCPAGAFLSLFNGLRAFRRLQPPRYPALCDLGVETTADLDCLYCDRCVIALKKREQTESAAEPLRWQKPLFAAVVISVALVFLGGAWSLARTELSQAVAASEPGVPASVGKPRDLDVGKIKHLIEERRLSGHPGEFSQPLEDQSGPVAPKPAH